MKLIEILGVGMYKKILIIFLIMIFISLSFVNAIDLIKNDIGNYEYQEVDLQIGIVKQGIIEAKYQLKETNKIFYVKILSFDNSNDLNSYLNRKSKINTKEYGQETIYVEDNGYNLFWINGNNVIFVSSELGNPNNFPDELVIEYLKKYPNEFKENLLIGNLTKDLKWFVQSHPHTKSSNYYTDRLVHCSNKYDPLVDEFNFTNEDIQKIEHHCKSNNYFRIEGAKIPSEIVVCSQDLINYTENNFVGNIDYEIILQECLLRNRFKQDFPNKNSSYLLGLFNERNKMILEEINFTKKISSINGTANISRKTIKKKSEQKINPQYFRDESKDLEEFRSRLDPSALSKIEDHKRQNKPVLDIADEDESNFKGLLKKLFGWLPWFKK